MITVKYDEALRNDVISVPWQDRLDGYYHISAAGGSTCSESIGGEWLDWVRKEYGRYAELELESIPKKEWLKFEEYLAEDD